MKEVIVKETIQDLAYFVKAVEPQSFGEVLASSCPSFRMISMQHGSDQLSAILIVELNKICQLLAFKVTGEMITECAQNIASEFWYCKLDDIKLFKTYLFRNKLPVELYRNDALVLYRLYEEYELLRHREVMIESEKRRKQESEADVVVLSGKETPMPDWFKVNMEILEAKIEERKKAFNEVKPDLKSRTLEQIAEIAGIDFGIIAEKIKQNANANFMENGKKGETIELYRSYELAKITHDARIDIEWLKKYVA